MIVIVTLIFMILKGFLSGIGDLCSQEIEVKSCNLWKGMSSDKANLSGFQVKKGYMKDLWERRGSLASGTGSGAT